jgi:signal-transduction protein with cAMP-binding, CBS, and nucleotidyltransferase domain
MNDYNHAIRSTINTLSVDIEALNDAQQVLMQIKKALPGVHDKIIDECLEVVRAALTEPYIDLSVFLMGSDNDD